MIVYLDKLAPQQAAGAALPAAGEVPAEGRHPGLAVYHYYNPEIQATAKPVTLEVR